MYQEFLLGRKSNGRVQFASFVQYFRGILGFFFKPKKCDSRSAHALRIMDAGGELLQSIHFKRIESMEISSIAKNAMQETRRVNVNMKIFC